jgi:hypothetical protein
MNELTKEARALTAQRKCFACLASIPVGRGMALYCSHLRILLCNNGRCNRLAFDCDKDSSRRGIRRPPTEVRRLIREMAARQQPVGVK